MTNRINNSNIRSQIQELDISRIPNIDIWTLMNHYSKAGLSYNLIDNITITANRDYKVFKTFKFDDLTEEMIPFIKFIPKIRTTSFAISPSANLTFIPNWLQIDNKYVLLIGMYARAVDDDDNDIQLIVSLDIAIKSLSYVQQIYQAKQ